MDSSRTSGACVEQLSVWVGAGLVTAGMSAALVAGASAASADSGLGADSSGGASSNLSGSDSKGSDATKPRPKPDQPDKTDAEGPLDAADETSTPDAAKNEQPEPTGQVSQGSKGFQGKGDRTTTRSKLTRVISPGKSSATESATTESSPDDEATAKKGVIKSIVPVVDDAPDEPAAKRIVSQDISSKSVIAASLVQTAPVAPAAPSLLGVVQGVINAVVASVGSLVFNALQAVETLVTGPPVVPPGSTVTVRSSTVQLTNGQRVLANWFYPETPDGKPPANMILLQHGFLALGPMYSYTAANLAEKTNSVVVTTTLSSNPFAGDSFWLGGTAMSASIADLFVGDRAALTASALDAGYATQYDFGTGAAALPQKFALAGHSLGANLVAGAAGFLVDKGAADDLVGVILLDGVPLGTTLPDALVKLNGYAASDGGHYIPVREIGAPVNLYNSTSTVNADLTAARPNRFNGVVLEGGVHSDPMRGGNPLIQFGLYVAAGFPQPQNPPAVDQLSVQWANEWFAGNSDAGDDLVPGTTIDVSTPQGTAHGVVIGNPPEAKLLRGPVDIASSGPSTIPSANPTMAALAA
jgi:pimeloyl-ACP methyl ester carboxylesterase